MAEEVHVHQEPRGGGMGWVIGAVVLALLIVLIWFLFVGGGAEDAGTTIEVPEEIDVDIQTPPA